MSSLNNGNPFLSSATAEDDKVVWSTKTVEYLIEAMDEGANVKVAKPFYEGNLNLRKGNIVFEYTKHEIDEIKKCRKDIVYFAEKYATVMTDDGLQRIKLRDYQKDMLRHFVANRFNVVLASRQIGKTICSSIFIAWYSLFNFDKNTLVVANKGATMKEILDKGKAILENLPFFMKPGILKYDVQNMKFDNGCRIQGQSTSGKAGIGFTIHLLFLDEFAHVKESFVNSFYENIYPTLSASAISRIIITSTPNGFNKFFKIYDEATKGDNEYAPFKVDWWQVPGRDEAWREREIKNLGSEEAFNRQYGNQFMASSSILLKGTTLKRLSNGAHKYQYVDFEELEQLERDLERYLKFSPEFDVDNIKAEDNYFVFSVDIGAGEGGDESVINIFQVLPMEKKYYEKIPTPGSVHDFFMLKQVGIFRGNDIPIEDFSKILYVVGYEIFFSENVKIVLEWNAFGGEVIKNLQTCFPFKNNFDEESIVKYKHRADAKLLKFGLRLKVDNKLIICQDTRKQIEYRRIEIDDFGTVEQFKTFGKLAKGSYGGQQGNDDAAMTVVNASTFLNTMDFADFVDEYLDQDQHVHLNDEMEAVLYKDRDSVDGNLNFDIYDLIK